MLENKQEFTKVDSFVKMVENVPRVTSPLKMKTNCIPGVCFSKLNKFVSCRDVKISIFILTNTLIFAEKNVTFLQQNINLFENT